MGRDRLKQIAGWLLTTAFEIGAGIMITYAAWALVAILAVAGFAILVWVYLPTIQKSTSNSLTLNILDKITSVVAAVIVLVSIGFYGTNAYRYFSVPNPTTFRPEPWAVRTRAFVRETPAELANYYRTFTHVEASRIFSGVVGKWMAITGTVSDVREPDLAFANVKGLPQRYNVSLNSRDFFFVSLSFDKKWADQIEVLRKDDRIYAYCKIATQQIVGLSLEECEMAHPF